jgi:hypothetical protein
VQLGERPAAPAASLKYCPSENEAGSPTEGDSAAGNIADRSDSYVWVGRRRVRHFCDLQRNRAGVQYEHELRAHVKGSPRIGCVVVAASSEGSPLREFETQGLRDRERLSALESPRIICLEASGALNRSVHLPVLRPDLGLSGGCSGFRRLRCGGSRVSPRVISPTGHLMSGLRQSGVSVERRRSSKKSVSHVRSAQLHSRGRVLHMLFSSCSATQRK